MILNYLSIFFPTTQLAAAAVGASLPRAAAATPRIFFFTRALPAANFNLAQRRLARRPPRRDELRREHVQAQMTLTSGRWDSLARGDGATSAR